MDKAVYRNRIMDAAYSTSYYEGVDETSDLSAQVVMGLVWRMFQPRSLVDVGYGSGAWSRASCQLGCERVLALDGPAIKHVDDGLPFATGEFDLEAGIDNIERFEMAICLEVAEHLEADKAELLVKWLTKTSDRVLFSAAAPLQSGMFHLNEQPQSYWKRLFEQQGFVAHDVIRPEIWSDDRVAWWYRQNAIVYSKPDAETKQLGTMAPADPIWDVVHPKSLEEKLSGSRERCPSCGVLKFDETPKEEPVVTRKMLEAGVGVLFPEIASFYESNFDLLAKVYREMRKAEDCK